MNFISKTLKNKPLGIIVTRWKPRTCTFSMSELAIVAKRDESEVKQCWQKGRIESGTEGIKSKARLKPAIRVSESIGRSFIRFATKSHILVNKNDKS